MRVVALTRAKLAGSWIKPRQWAKSRREMWSLQWGRHRWQLVTDPRLGTWYSGFWDGEKWVPAFEHWPGFRGLFMLPKKKASAVAAEVDHVASIESKVFTKWAPLVAHIAATRYDDASPRRPGQIVITVQGDMWCVDCRDLDTAKRIKALAPTIDAALALASALVAAPDTPWEHASWLEQEPPKKSGKRR